MKFEFPRKSSDRQLAVPNDAANFDTTVTKTTDTHLGIVSTYEQSTYYTREEKKKRLTHLTKSALARATQRLAHKASRSISPSGDGLYLGNSNN